ncbi:MAG: hypothetical protein E5V74_25170, partial [Mesorhizobium sp.]
MNLALHDEIGRDPSRPPLSRQRLKASPLLQHWEMSAAKHLLATDPDALHIQILRQPNNVGS